MKIAVNTRFLIKNKLEGIGRFTFETLKIMAETHPDDTFYFLFDRPFDPSFVFADNVKPVVLYPPARHPFLFIIWFEIAVRWYVNRIIKPDVFLSPDNFTSIGVTPPSVMVVHDIAYKHFDAYDKDFQKWYYRFFTPRFLRRANHIVAVSDFTKTDLLRHFSFLNEDKISVCGNRCSSDFKIQNIDNQLFIKNKLTKGKPYWLYVGSIHPRKNVARLIEAFTIFKKQSGADMALVVGGKRAWKTADVEVAYTQSAYKTDIIFTDYIDEKDLPLIVGSAFGLVYISLFEGFGIPILEAMQSGVPVITSSVSSMPEVSGDAAMLVDPTSTEGVAEAMIRLWSDENLRADLIEKGKKRCCAFSWSSTATILYEALLKVKDAHQL